MEERPDKNEMQFLKTDQMSLYKSILDFLEAVYIRRGTYIRSDATEESPMDILVLNFTKVVNDCRAILFLTDQVFYIQAGILCRSTIDSCNLMMHIVFEGDNATLLAQWLNGRPLRHWALMKTLNNQVDQNLDFTYYKEVRGRLDDFVHANFKALQLYPAQAPGPTPLDSDSFKEMTFWKWLLELFLVSCLMSVPAMVPDLEHEANNYLEQLGVEMDLGADDGA
jgi:hypothetical protein